MVRILGGAGYWPYGLEALHAGAGDPRRQLAVLPGDDKPDPGLTRFCTLGPDERDRLWRYLVEGGAENARELPAALRARSWRTATGRRRRSRF